MAGRSGLLGNRSWRAIRLGASLRSPFSHCADSCCLRGKLSSVRSRLWIFRMDPSTMTCWAIASQGSRETLESQYSCVRMGVRWQVLEYVCREEYHRASGCTSVDCVLSIYVDQVEDLQLGQLPAALLPDNVQHLLWLCNARRARPRHICCLQDHAVLTWQTGEQLELSALPYDASSCSLDTLQQHGTALFMGQHLCILSQGLLQRQHPIKHNLPIVVCQALLHCGKPHLTLTELSAYMTGQE